MRDRRGHFRRLYENNIDPWGFETSSYEQDKYAETIKASGGRSYAHCIEAGCSIGVLSERLAQQCKRFTGIELNDAAAAIARERLAPTEHAQIITGELPGIWPQGEYDLVVLSEVLYFLSRSEIAALSQRVARDWSDGGDCLLVNWLGETQTGLSGEDASAEFRQMLARHVSFSERRLNAAGSNYQLIVLRRI